MSFSSFSRQELRRVLESLRVCVRGVEMPVVLLGTSPFIGAGQFGDRSFQYYRRFYENPANIRDLIVYSAELGVWGIQLLSAEPLVEAFREAVEILRRRMVVVATVGPARPLEDIRLMAGLEASAMLIHAGLSDRLDRKGLSKLLSEIRDSGALAGLVSHSPARLLRWLLDTRLEVDLLMVPVNLLNLYMDAPVEEIAEMARSLEATVIAKKVLAAGRLKPKKALNFVASLDFVDAVAVGVASKEEADETFTEAANAFLRRSGTKKDS